MKKSRGDAAAATWIVRQRTTPAGTADAATLSATRLDCDASQSPDVVGFRATAAAGALLDAWAEARRELAPALDICDHRDGPSFRAARSSSTAAVADVEAAPRRLCRVAPGRDRDEYAGFCAAHGCAALAGPGLSRAVVDARAGGGPFAKTRVAAGARGVAVFVRSPCGYFSDESRRRRGCDADIP